MAASGGAPVARRSRRWLAVAALAALACAPASRESPPPDAPPRDPAEIERGRRLFLGACAGYCHAPRDGGGGGEAPDLFDCEWRHGGGDAQLFRTISLGVPGTPMLGFADSLGERDIWRLVAYLRGASRCDAPPPGGAVQGSVYAITQSPIFPRR